MIEENKNIGYGNYIISWVSVVLLVILQVVLSGLNLGSNTNFIILLLASIAAFVVIQVFMTDKSNKLTAMIFKGIIVAEILIVILFDLLK